MRIKIRDALPFLISAGILAILLHNTDIAAMMATFGNADLSYVLLGVLFTFAVMLLRIVRWKLFLDTYRHNIRFIDIASSFMASQFLANFTPARVGEASRPYFLKKRYKTSFFNMLPPVIVERALDLLILLTLSLLFFITYSSMVSAILLAVLGVIGVLTGALILFIIIFIFNKKIASSLMSFFFRTFSFVPTIRELKPKANKFAANFFKGVSAMRFARFGPITAITIMTWVFESAILYFSILALVPGADFNLIYAIGFLCISMLGGVISSLPGGIGSVEAILFAFFLLTGFAAPLSLSIVVLYRFISFFISTIFFTLFFIREMRT